MCSEKHLAVCSLHPPIRLWYRDMYQPVIGIGKGQAEYLYAHMSDYMK